MSLHAQLSPQARQRYDTERRSSTILSVVISILSVTLVVLVLAFLILELPAKSVPAIGIIASGKIPDDPPPRKEVNIFRKPSPAPGGAPSRIIVALSQTNLAIPTPEVTPGEVEPFGDGTGFGDGIGEDSGFPSGFNPIPLGPSAKRCSKQDRLKRLEETGGPVEVEEAVVKALRWLKDHQNQDGSWGTGNKVGMTGLALLAYLGHCETPVSEEFGQSCTDGIVYLLDLSAKNKGRMATNFQNKHWPYEHALATYALAEALSFAKVFHYNLPGHHQAVQASGQWIIDNQHRSGGWDYSYDEAGGRGGE